MTAEGQTEAEPPKLPVMPGSIKDAVLTELDGLDNFVRNLSLQDWEKPSAAGGWSIGDVVAHLNLALGLYGRVLDAIIAGRGSGSAWRAFGRLTKTVAPVGSHVFNALNSAIPRVMDRALSPEVIKGQFAAGSRTLRDKLAKVGSEDFTRPAHYMGRPWPLSFFLAAVLNELAVHGWDMSSPLTPDSHLSAEARSVLPWFYWGASSYMLHRPAELTGTIAASLADPDAEMWWRLGDGETTQGTGRPEKADVTISGESGTFVLVLAGRITPDDGFRTTSLSAVGDEQKAKSFLSSWKIT